MLPAFVGEPDGHTGQGADDQHSVSTRCWHGLPGRLGGIGPSCCYLRPMLSYRALGGAVGSAAALFTSFVRSATRGGKIMPAARVTYWATRLHAWRAWGVPTQADLAKRASGGQGTSGRVGQGPPARP